jgi:hypothetical protein
MKLSDTAVTEILGTFADRFSWDYASTYGEPGYENDDVTAVVLGNFWIDNGPQGSLSSYENRWPRLWAALEDAGVRFEWYDEWVVDGYNKAYRCQPDSYSWLPSFVDDNGELLTRDDDIAFRIEWALNNHRRALPPTVATEAELEGEGFTRWPSSDEHYQNGWHPGQDDTPEEVVAAIRAEHGDEVDIVFLLLGKGQFDVHFAAMIRPVEV